MFFELQCVAWHLLIGVHNGFSLSMSIVTMSHDINFFMLLKLQYRPSRWVQLVEAMAICHFIEEVHTSLINKFPLTRVRPFERFMKWHRIIHPQVVAQYEDLQRTIVKLEAKEAGGQTTRRSNDYHENDEDKNKEVERLTKWMKVGRDAIKWRRRLCKKNFWLVEINSCFWMILSLNSYLGLWYHGE